MKDMEPCQLGQALVDVGRPAAADNYTSIWGSKSYMINSGEGISHLLREPLLAEHLVLAPDFSLQVRHRCFLQTLCCYKALMLILFTGHFSFQRHQGETCIPWTVFGLLMMKTITYNFFVMIRNESPSDSRHGLVFLCDTPAALFSYWQL
jgi:hypothetical protein